VTPPPDIYFSASSLRLIPVRLFTVSSLISIPPSRSSPLSLYPPFFPHFAAESSISFIAQFWCTRSVHNVMIGRVNAPAVASRSEFFPFLPAFSLERTRISLSLLFIPPPGFTRSSRRIPLLFSDLGFGANSSFFFRLLVWH